MSHSCSKEFTLTVSENLPTAYWTFEEAAGSRIDKVQALPLQIVTGAAGTKRITNGAGFIGNGIRLQQGGTFLLCIADTGDVAALKTTGVGWSIAGWFLLNFGSAIVVPSLSLIFNDIPASIILQLGDAGLNNHGIAAYTDANSQAGNIPFGFTAGAWHFFHMFFNGSQFGFAVNNAAPTLIGAAVSYPANTIGRIVIGGADGDMQIDEMAVKLNGSFTTVQTDYLYNCGAGRTWPIAFPSSFSGCPDLCVNATDWAAIDAVLSVRPFPGPWFIGTNHMTFASFVSPFNTWNGQAQSFQHPQTFADQNITSGQCLVSIMIGNLGAPSNVVYTRNGSPLGTYTLLDNGGQPGLPATISVDQC